MIICRGATNKSPGPAYYPAAVIDTHVASMLTKLQPFLPLDVLCLLKDWVELTQIYGGETNRAAAGVGDDSFWQRLASTTYVVNVVCAQSIAQQKGKDLA